MPNNSELKELEVQFKSTIGNFTKFVAETKDMGLSAASVECDNYHIELEVIEGLVDHDDIGDDNVMEALVGLLGVEIVGDVYGALGWLSPNKPRLFDVNQAKGKLTILVGGEYFARLTRK